jgi:hypothetical protein
MWYGTGDYRSPLAAGPKLAISGVHLTTVPYLSRLTGLSSSDEPPGTENGDTF